MQQHKYPAMRKECGPRHLGCEPHKRFKFSGMTRSDWIYSIHPSLSRLIPYRVVTSLSLGSHCVTITTTYSSEQPLDLACKSLDSERNPEPQRERRFSLKQLILKTSPQALLYISTSIHSSIITISFT